MCGDARSGFRKRPQQDHTTARPHESYDTTSLCRRQCRRPVGTPDSPSHSGGRACQATWRRADRVRAARGLPESPPSHPPLLELAERKVRLGLRQAACQTEPGVTRTCEVAALSLPPLHSPGRRLRFERNRCPGPRVSAHSRKGHSPEPRVAHSMGRRHRGGPAAWVRKPARYRELMGSSTACPRAGFQALHSNPFPHDDATRGEAE